MGKQNFILRVLFSSGLLFLGFMSLTSDAFEQSSIQSPAKAQEQVQFGTEDPVFLKPVPVPDPVFDALRTLLKAPADEISADWFQASEVRLSRREKADLIVAGVGLRGAHNLPFWIFTNVHGEFQLTLATATDSLTLQGKYRNGYRNIEISGFSGDTITTTIYGFDGKRYVRISEKTNPSR